MIQKLFSKSIKAILRAIMFLPRKKHYERKQKTLTNSDFSIISSDCFGTFVYHNLNQRFNSPTINLFFPPDDFFQFVSHLKEYLSEELIEVEDHNESYPVGKLTYNGHTIRINFMHYQSFQEAKDKWEERKMRINYSNIYIAQTIGSGLTQEYVDKFSALPYSHKMLITAKNDLTGDCMVFHDIFSKPNYKPGEFLTYKSLVSLDRHMDDIDYVGWINNR